MAKEYIEREAAIDALCYFDEKSPTERTAREVVKNLPAADVRSVVTCIECKHSCDMPGGLRCCHGTCVDCYVEPEFFCADGVKREES